MGPDAMILAFWMLSFKPTFSLSFFTFITRLFSSSLSAIRWCHLHIWGYWYFSWKSWFQLVLLPAQCFSWCTLHIRLNKQGEILQPWRTPFPIWSHSVVPCPVLTVASCPAYKFFKRQVRWSGILISWRIFQFVVIHIVKGFCVVNKAEIDVFLELSCFSDNPVDVDNLISVYSAFSKTSLKIWNFTVHVLLKPGLENFEHYFTSMWDKCNCVVVWAFFGIVFLWD